MHSTRTARACSSELPELSTRWRTGIASSRMPANDLSRWVEYEPRLQGAPNRAFVSPIDPPGQGGCGFANFQLTSQLDGVVPFLTMMPRTIRAARTAFDQRGQMNGQILPDLGVRLSQF